MQHLKNYLKKCWWECLWFFRIGWTCAAKYVDGDVVVEHWFHPASREERVVWRNINPC